MGVMTQITDLWMTTVSPIVPNDTTAQLSSTSSTTTITTTRSEPTEQCEISSSPSQRCRVYVVAGLFYGDEGKGTIVDYLVRHFGSRLVVRYGSGPQAAHHVVNEDGTWHCFSQFGAGMLVPGVRCLLSRYMLVSPHNLLRYVRQGYFNTIDVLLSLLGLR
jgi:hypothetical protein